MSRSVSRLRTAAVSAALVLAAVGGTAAALTTSAGGELTGTTGPDAAYKRVGDAPHTAAQALGTTFTSRATVAGSTSYAFSTVLSGAPVRFDPCTPIRWTSSTARGPVGGLAVLTSAVATIAAATGTTWQYAGPTDAAPSTALLPKAPAGSYPPVVVGWADAASSDLLAGQPRSVLGMTRTAWFGVQLPDGRKIAATRGAVVVLDRTDALPLRGASSWESVTLHELAHAMGLAHVADSTQLMASVLPRGLADLQAGDRAGLARLGGSAGCVVVPS
jgi:hypothetical protein